MSRLRSREPGCRFGWGLEPNETTGPLGRFLLRPQTRWLLLALLLALVVPTEAAITCVKAGQVPCLGVKLN